MIDYKIISLKNLERIEPMWEQLINYLKDKSNKHKIEFQDKTFKNRIQPYLDKVNTGLSRLVCATHEGVDIAYCLSSITSKGIGEVDSIYINPDYRGNGIGEYLMRDAFHFFERNKTIQDIVMVSEGNENVMRFYESMGYELRYYTLRRKK